MYICVSSRRPHPPRHGDGCTGLPPLWVVSPVDVGGGGWGESGGHGNWEPPELGLRWGWAGGPSYRMWVGAHRSWELTHS